MKKAKAKAPERVRIQKKEYQALKSAEAKNSALEKALLETGKELANYKKYNEELSHTAKVNTFTINLKKVAEIQGITNSLESLTITEAAAIAYNVIKINGSINQ